MIQRLYTAIRDTPDAADKIAAPDILLPPRADLSAWLPPVRDQGNEGACTMFAGSGILAWHYKRSLGKDLVFSPQFGYRAERILEGDIDVDGGAQSRTMMKVLTQYGLCLEASDPYVDTGWKNPTTLAQLAEARNYRLGAYHRVPDLQTLKSVLASGYVASLGIDVYESFESDEVAANGAVPMPKAGEQCLGGHEVYCYGYNDALGLLLCRNSWGADWGDHGNFSLPYAYWKFVSDSWTCHFGKPWGTATVAPAADAPKQSFFFGGDELLRRLDNIERNTYLLIQQSRRILVNLTDIDNALGTVDTDLATLQTDNQAILAKLAAGPQTPDTTAQVNHIKAIDTLIQTLIAADTAGQGTTGSTGTGTTGTTGTTGS
jgi:hypothetical protein